MGIVELLTIAWVVGTALCLGFVIARAHRRAMLGRGLSPAMASSTTWPARPDQAPLLPLSSRELDVEREVAAALGTLRDTARRAMVELQVALQPRLAVWADPFALRRVLVTVLTQAIERTPDGGVLLCAAWHGGRVHVTITDDGAVGDPMLLAAGLRQVEQCVALQGGTLEIACTPTRGNVLTLRLPGPRQPQPESLDDTPVEEPRISGSLRRGFAHPA